MTPTPDDVIERLRDALSDAICEAYRANRSWESAKDVAENIDTNALVRYALAAVSDTHVLVPRMPTPWMLQAVVAENRGTGCGPKVGTAHIVIACEADAANRVYKAMLAAAPKVGG